MGQASKARPAPGAQLNTLPSATAAVRIMNATRFSPRATVLALSAALVFHASNAGQAQQRVLPSSRDQVHLSSAPLVSQVAPSVVNIFTRRIVCALALL